MNVNLLSFKDITIQKGSSKDLWVFIKNGKLHHYGLNTFEIYQHKLTPMMESHLKNSYSKFWDISEINPEEVEKKILDFYLSLKNTKTFFPGPFC